MRLPPCASVPAWARAILLVLLACLAGASPAAAELAGATTAGSQAAAARIASSVLGSCAIAPQATLHCWGDGYHGQLATEDGEDVGSEPGTSTVHVFLGRGAVPAQVSSGYAHTCAVDTAGGVWCWGRNISGQAGDGSAAEFLGDDPGERPHRVALPGGQTARQVAAGREHTCALLADRTVACWGGNLGGQLGLGTIDGDVHLPATVDTGGPVFSLATRTDHTCVVLMTHKVRCWGANGRGQLGVAEGVAAPPRATPTAPTMPGASGNFIGISVGRAFTCGITAPAGDVVCWGENDSGQLSRGNDTPTTAPGSTASTVNLGGAKAVAISTGDETACALTDAGAVRCWGSNGPGQLGGGFVGTDWGDNGGETSPITVAIGSARVATALAVGGDHTCALLNTGAPLCWGEGGSGQRANGAPDDSLTATPASLAPVAFAADWPDGDGDGLPDRYDGCPAAASTADDGCPPPPTPVPPTQQPPVIQQPPGVKPPVTPPPVVGQPARKLKIAVTLKAKGKSKSCPKGGAARVVGAKPPFGRSVTFKKRKGSGPARCATKATISWPTAPAVGTKVKVRVSAKGLTSRTITVKVSG